MIKCPKCGSDNVSIQVVNDNKFVTYLPDYVVYLSHSLKIFFSFFTFLYPSNVSRETLYFSK